MVRLRDQIRLLFVDGWGGLSSTEGHFAPNLSVRLHRGFAERFSLTLALLGPMPGRYEASLASDSCRVMYLPPYRSKWEYLARRTRTRRLLGEATAHADLVVVRIPSIHGVDALRIARLRGLPAVCLIVGMWEETIGTRGRVLEAVYSWFARWVTRRAAADADLVLAQGEPLRRYLSRLGIEAVPVIESPLEPEDFVTKSGANRRSDDLEIVTISRLVRSKNISAVIEATRLLRDTGIASRLRLVGGGELEGVLRRQVAKLGLEPYVEVLGRVDDRTRIREILASSDVFALPSLIEGVPSSVLEAMAAGLAVVAAPVGGLADLLVDEANAIVVKAPTPQNLTRAFVRLARDRTLRTRLGIEARERAREHLHSSWVEHFREIVLSKLPVATGG
jgi:glycosyltransferase involved in cell wall biosynthesis